MGVIGMSEGNGHPYSWSAIFNGFNPAEMAKCPFPLIPDYLSTQRFPEDFLSDKAEVTHIWTQDIESSKQIASASKILRVVERKEDLIGQVDAILLARDDAEYHVEISLPFLKAGLPIFIDKPFALTAKDANTMLDSQVYDSQIFTCSALRFAEELKLSEGEISNLGDIVYVEGSAMKKWETYGIHILEPLVAQLPNRGKLMSVLPVKSSDVHLVTIQWENCMASLKMTGKIPAPLSLSFFGRKNSVTRHFKDSFACFRASLSAFIDQRSTGKKSIPDSEILELVSIIEKGRC